MEYTLADLPQLKADLVGNAGLWGMLKKDLRQLVEMPSHFDPSTQPVLGTGLNLSLMMVAMGGLEAMATLANIDEVASKQGTTKNAIDIVKRFGDRYFPEVNPLYTRPKGESLLTLIWDGYRNGGLHNFFPKQDMITTTAGPKKVLFSVSWPTSKNGNAERCLTLAEIQVGRANNPTVGGPGARHLDAEMQSNGDISIFLSSPVFALELIDAGDRWAAELEQNGALQGWFVEGAARLSQGLTFQNLPGAKACLDRMVNAAVAAVTPPST